MRLTITTNHIQRIHAHALTAYPDECCGLMVGTVDGDGCRVVELCPSDNTAPDPAKRYVIDPLVYLRADRAARKRGMDVVGIYHSHPDTAPVPSRTDGAESWPGYAYLIAQVRDGETGPMQAWRFDEAKQASEMAVVQSSDAG